MAIFERQRKKRVKNVGEKKITIIKGEYTHCPFCP
jgi:hypothetical protein